MKSIDAAFATLKTRAEPLLERYRELQPREQVIVGVGTVVVVITLIYLVLWEPFANVRSSQQAALIDARATAQRLESLAAAAQKAQAAGLSAIQGQGQSLLSLVDQQGKSPELGKAPARLQPDGDNEVKVWFEDVPFDALVRWMSTLQSRYGVEIVAAEFERRAGEGLVNARLTVKRP